MMLAGASAIQVGTAMFADAYAPLKMIEGIERYLEEHQIQSVTELTGRSKYGRHRAREVDYCAALRGDGKSSPCVSGQHRL